MVSQVQSATQPGIFYPDDDGKPMSDNTKQFRWIMVIYYNLEWLFADDLMVFVAGNLIANDLEICRNNIAKGKREHPNCVAPIL